MGKMASQIFSWVEDRGKESKNEDEKPRVYLAKNLS